MEANRVIDDDVLSQVNNISIKRLKDLDKPKKEQKLLKNLDEETLQRITSLAQSERRGSWGWHRELKAEIPTIEFISTICKNLAKLDLLKGAALSLLYLSGARIGEIIGNNFRDGTVWEGIRLGDIKFHKDKNGDFITIKTLIQKQHINLKAKEKGKKYKFNFKVMYIPVDNVYKDMINIIWDYLKKYEFSFNPQQPLFGKLNYHAFEWYMKHRVGKYSFHIFRHWRTTHLVQYHNFKEVELRIALGWDKQSQMPTVYTHSNKKIFLSKMRTALNYV